MALGRGGPGTGSSGLGMDGGDDGGDDGGAEDRGGLGDSLPGGDPSVDTSESDDFGFGGDYVGLVIVCLVEIHLLIPQNLTILVLVEIMADIKHQICIVMI